MASATHEVKEVMHGHAVAHTHHEHHKESFWTKYIFSQDHKMIAKQYLITGFVMGLVGIILSGIFRLQLAFPDTPIPFLSTLLGKWAPEGRLDPNFYMALVTIHGTILVFFLLTGGLSGTFANLLIPLQVGARDMASPFVNMLSFHFFFWGSVVMVASLFVETGPAAAGWTVYPPLSALPKAMPGSGLGMILWMVSITLFVVGVLMGGLNYITTVLNMRTKGMSLMRMPLSVWALFVTAVLGLLSFPPAIAAFFLLLFDHSFGTNFYLSEIYIGGEALPMQGGNVLLYLHLFWFLGHPEVYIVLLPALGITSEVISTYARKPIFGYKVMVWSILGIAFVSFIVWAHHMFVTGMNPLLGSIFTITTLLVAIPSAMKIFNYIFTLWKGKIHFTAAMLFAIGVVSFFISGGLTGFYLGVAPTDIALHNTYFVVGHFHLVMGVSAVFAMYAGTYHWFPKLFGRMMNERLGYIHFWLTFIGANLVFFPMYFMGMGGVPRRYYSFTEFDFTRGWIDLNVVITVAALVTILAQFVFVYNFIHSIFWGKKASINPWKANSLEWSSPVEHIHGNWVGSIPKVYRWPYDYSKPGAPADFIPQYISDEDIARGVRYWEEDFDPRTVIDRLEENGKGGGEGVTPQPTPPQAVVHRKEDTNTPQS
ncbi:MAG: cytochrome c oxidase subunit I [Bacteroidia bacterium]